MQRTNISCPQFFIIMFVSGSVVTLTLSTPYIGGENLLESIVSYLVAMAAGLVLALPVLVRRNPVNVPQKATDCLGLAGRLFPLVYILYFILTGGSSLALFQIFLMDTVNPGFSAGLVSAALVGVALYGALRGLETVARSATCVFVVMLLGCGLVFGIVAGRFNPENLEPLFYHGLGQTKQGVGLFLARASIFADMAVLLPQVHGRKAWGFVGWIAGSAAFVGGTILLTAGCLGRYATTQNFPVYVLASLTQVRSLQRLDAVFTGIWMMGLTIKLACDLYACRVCCRVLAPGREPRRVLWLTAGAVLALGLLAVNISVVQRMVTSTPVLFWCTVGVAIAPPVLVWLAERIRRAGQKT